MRWSLWAIVFSSVVAISFGAENPVKKLCVIPFDPHRTGEGGALGMLSPDGKRVITRSLDKNELTEWTRIYNSETGEVISETSRVHHKTIGGTISADGSRIAMNLVTDSLTNDQFEVIDLSTNKTVLTLQGATLLYPQAISADGSLVAVSRARGAKPYGDRCVDIFSIDKQQSIGKVPLADDTIFASDSRLVLKFPESFEVWDLKTMQRLYAIPIEHRSTRAVPLEDKIYRIAENSELTVHEAKTGQVVSKGMLPPGALWMTFLGTRNKHLVIGGHGTLLECDPATGKELLRMDIGPRPGSTMLSLRSNRLLVAAESQSPGDLVVFDLPAETVPSTQRNGAQKNSVTEEKTAPLQIVDPRPDQINSAAWWLDRAEAEITRIRSDDDRAVCLYSCADRRARLGQLEMAESLLKQASSISPASVKLRGMRYFVKQSAFEQVVRLKSRKDGIEAAMKLLAPLSDRERIDGDWLYPAALALGRSDANDMDSTKQFVSSLPSGQRTKVIERVIESVCQRGKSGEAKAIYALIDSGPYPRPVATRLAQHCAHNGDFATALTTLATLVDLAKDIDQQEVMQSNIPRLTESIGYESTRLNQPEVIEKARSIVKPFHADYLLAGKMKSLLDQKDYKSADALLETLPSRSDARTYHEVMRPREFNLTAYMKNFSLEPPTGSSWPQLFSALMQMNRLDDAFKLKDDPRLLASNKECIETSMRVLAGGLYRTGRIDDADRIYRTLNSAFQPNDYRHLEYTRATALYRTGNHAPYEAILSELKGDSTENIVRRHSLQESAGDYETMVGEYDRLVKIPAQKNAASFYLKGMVSHALRDTSVPNLEPVLSRAGPGDIDEHIVNALDSIKDPAKRSRHAIKLVQAIPYAQNRATVLSLMAGWCIPPDPVYFIH